MTASRLTPVFLCFALMAAGCAQDKTCVPNEQTACACPGGGVGAQVCSEDGTRFGPCSALPGSCSGEDAPACVHGACEIVGGLARCACEDGYAGVLCEGCADGFQDHDGDGTCTPACGTVTCGAHEVCDDSAGTARCTCAPGFGLPGDGGTTCEFKGIVEDPSFEADPPAWTVSPDGGVIEPATEGRGDLGRALLFESAACSGDRIEQEVRIPPIEASGGLRLSWQTRALCRQGTCTAIGEAMFWLNGLVDRRFVSSGWASGSACLGERAYGGTWKLGLAADPKVTCTDVEPAIAFDHVRIDPDPSCPLPGEVLNGDFEGTGGWELYQSSIQPNVGEQGSRGLVLAPDLACAGAAAMGLLSIPAQGANALQLRYGGVAGSDVEISLADWKLARLVARGGGVLDTVALCIPEALKGAAPSIQLIMRESSADCGAADPRRLYVDDVALVYDPTCGTDASVLNGSFERTDPALGWYLAMINNRSWGGAGLTTSDAKVGARSLHMNLTSPCGRVIASSVITVATPQGGAGPAVKYWYRTEGTAGIWQTNLGAGEIPLTSTWTARIECLPPALAGMPKELKFEGASVGGYCATTISESLFVDDVRSTTDESCPAE